jgi:hypothetical protein
VTYGPEHYLSRIEIAQPARAFGAASLTEDIANIKLMEDAGGEGQSILHELREHGQTPGGRGRGRPGSFQPLLSTGLESLEVTPNILFSTPMAMRLPLRWIAILRGRITASLAATSGIHRAADAIKMLLVGADVTELCSALMRHGIKHISAIEHDLRIWLEEHEYDSVEQLKGSLSQKNCDDPSAYERAQYMRAISTFPFPARTS